MSSPKLHLPILKGYLLGEAISSHDGVCCYPAIKRGTDEKYILKIISIPDHPDRLEALLLTGAVASKKAALAYFMDLAKDTLGQADILHELSHQEGFVPYLDSQIDPMETETGYDVYLLGTYKRSLERILRTEAMTHAEVIHMGLDLCAALAACRRAGYLYADLKPGNIFHDPEQGFRIGDVGFISLQSLKYASLPDKYRSSYTAPELSDVFAALNTTVDIYALGLVLYQAYNGGVLPFDGPAPTETLPTPLYADYEMASIILKACHPDPSQRWQQPTQMAQALIGYMQEFGASEAAIIPPVLDAEEPESESTEAVEEFLPEMDADQLQQEMADLENAQPEELAFLSGLTSDETAPSDENTADVSEDVVTEEISQMLAQADELIAHTLPEPPVAPAPIDVPMPEPIVLEPEEDPVPVEEGPAPEEEAPAEEAAQPVPAEAAAQAGDAPAEPDAEPAPEEAAAVVEAAEPQVEEDAPRRRFPWRAFAVAAVITVLIGLFAFGKYYYDNYYLLNVEDLILTGEDVALTVEVVSDIDDTLIRVVCTDIYGNSTQSGVVGGIATFYGLNPSTRYTVRVEPVGSHKLTGTTTDSFTTAAQTQILSFTAGIGPEDCSVQLNFTLSGPASDKWTVSYSADGIEAKSQDFTGRSTVVYGLEPGKMYTFTLSSASGLYVGGQTQASYLATNILCAEYLRITAAGDGTMQVQWQQPDNGTVALWQVRCYNAEGFSQSVTTTENSYTFTGLDQSVGYTVEVTAEGMNRSVSTSISPAPITVTDLACRLTADMALELTWNYSGQDSVSGWVLRYSIDGGTETAVTLEQNRTAVLAAYNGVYCFTLEAADGSTVLGGSCTYVLTELELFGKYAVTYKDMTVQAFLLPEGDDWTAADIPADNFRPVFMVGEAVGLLISVSPLEPEDIDAKMNIQFVLHDPNGVHLQTDSVTAVWNDMWSEGNCVLILPYLPEAAGNYILSLYFDGCFVWQQDFVIG